MTKKEKILYQLRELQNQLNSIKTELDEKEPLQQLPMEWEELGRVKGFYVLLDSSISNPVSTASTISNKNVFTTIEQAEASVALAMLSQLMLKWNNGWTPNWNDQEVKFVIWTLPGSIQTGNIKNTRYFLAFKTKELRNDFAVKFAPLIMKASVFI